MDHIEAIEAALAQGPTPGPWKKGSPHRYCTLPHPEDNGAHGLGKCDYAFREWSGDGTSIWREDDTTDAGQVAGMWDYEDGGIRREADAAYIAACHPEAIRSLLARLREAEEALRAALDAGQAQPVATVLPGALRRSPHDKDPEHWCHEALLYSPGSPHDMPERRINLYTAPQASQPVAPAGWKCGKCGVDRTKQVCPLGHSAALDGRCPMIAMALSAAAPAPAAQPLTLEQLRELVRVNVADVTESEAVLFYGVARAVERAHGIGGTNG